MDHVGRIKKVPFLAVLLFVFAVSAVHPDSDDIGFSVFFEGSWVFPIGFSFYPGAELTFYSFEVNDRTALSVGGAVTGQVAYANRTDLWSFTNLGAALGPLAVVTFQEAADSYTRFWERVELSFSPGLAFNYYIYAGDPAYYANRDTFTVGFAGFAGARLRLSRFFLIRLDATYWGRYIGPNIAIGAQLDLW